MNGHKIRRQADREQFATKHGRLVRAHLDRQRQIHELNLARRQLLELLRRQTPQSG